MMSVRGCLAVALVVSVAACAPTPGAKERPEPDLATVRALSWTNTAQELAGSPATAADTKASMYVFGGDPMAGASSIAAGDLVLSSVWTERAVTVVGQSAKTGHIAWRRAFPTKGDGYVECQDDDNGPVIACRSVTWPARKGTLWILDEKTGKTRTKLPIDPGAAVGISGDELYLATFEPDGKGSRLDVTVTRQSWPDAKPTWKRTTSFAIEGWGHDGGSGFQFGKERIGAHSASWQVILDRQTGRLLERSDQGRWEEPLADGGRVVVDSGDGTGERVDVTVFTAAGKPVADLQQDFYPEILELESGQVAIGRRLLDPATGKVSFTAPKRWEIVAVVDGGRVALVQQYASEFENPDGRVPFATYDTKTGQRLGTAALKGSWVSDTAASGHGVVQVVGHYDEKAETDRPPTVEVIDARKPGVVASLTLRHLPEIPGAPTLVRTSQGAAVTTSDAVHGLVAR